MRALIQRVKKSSVTVGNNKISQIGHGYVILLGIYKNDTDKDIDKLIGKILHLRIMDDGRGVMNKSILETNGEILVVSQFTLCADTKKGRRPSYINAMNPQEAEKLYMYFIQKLKNEGISVKTGTFGALMEVEILNDGPVTIILDEGH